MSLKEKQQHTIGFPAAKLSLSTKTVFMTDLLILFLMNWV